MHTQLHAIALRTVRHSDRHNILMVYTLERGRMSLLLGADNSRESVRRRALTMPLSLIECVTLLRPGVELPQASDMSAWRPLPSLLSNPAKGAIAMFLAEVLAAVLRQEGEADVRLFEFLANGIMRLNDERRPVSNFHLAFLMQLTEPLGVAPDMASYAPGYIFDMVDATFRPSPPWTHRHFLEPEESRAAALLWRMNLDNHSRFSLNRQQRAHALDVILQYYTIHYASLSTLRSLDVLRALS